MLEIRNRTPYEVALVPGLDRDGRDFATVVIKITFDLAEATERRQLPVAEEQAPIVWADEFYDEPDNSSIRYEADIGPAKDGTDVVLVGHAHAPDRRAEHVDVSVEAGPVSKTVRVFGDRRWVRSFGMTKKTAPEPFETMPLVYERAFGGADLSHSDESKHGWEARNPVGVSFTKAGKGDHFDDLPLPNLEDPRQLIKATDRPTPAGFGFIGRHWEPRKSLAGTYDDAWLEGRCPLLPADFDERYFRSAHPDLCSERAFLGGEPVLVRNASRGGEIRFVVPQLQFEVKASVQLEQRLLETSIDTILIEPDLDRVALTWKATIECARKFLLIDYVRVRELERLA